ncbi:MAG: hypothetical protein HRU25_00470 [Psychrobium sp.]|nr:hypothetical protein [Psychrobium sp.]
MAKGHAKFTVKTPIVASKDLQAMGYQLIITRSGLQRAAMSGMKKVLSEIYQVGHSAMKCSVLASVSR